MTDKKNHIMELFEFDEGQNLPVIGTDEAGRGPAAGGVFASAVYFPNVDEKLIELLADLNDSKQLSKKKRECLFDIIKLNTINSTVCIEVEEIERINILKSSLKAMKLACEEVIAKADLKTPLVLVDGNNYIREVKFSQKFVVKGDSHSASIAAASILAKVSRDRYMEELHEKYPHYGWAENSGYLTKSHLDAIDKFGLTEFHRASFLKKHFEKQAQLSLF